MSRLFNHFGKMLLFATLVAIVVTMSAYAMVQQDLRQSANDPQIQMAEDGAALLTRGISPQTVTGNMGVNAAVSLAPFEMVFDASGHVLATSGTFNSQALTPPAGVFAFTRQHGQDSFTWQPTATVRQAAVIVDVPGGHGEFMLAARSLREVELRESEVGRIAFITVGGIIAAAAICAVI